VHVLYYISALRTEHVRFTGLNVGWRVTAIRGPGNEIWKIQSTKEGGFRGRGTGLINKTKNIYES
jgi:hypothetical protein